MNIVLAAVNAKYIHSNLAVYSLRAYAKPYRTEIEIAEYTINQQTDDILMDIYKKKPDLLCVSCYIWNIRYVEEIVHEIKKILPEVQIWLGGPEVSYDAKDVLIRLPEVNGVIKGEGEQTFLEVLSYYHQDIHLAQIKGITYRDFEGNIHENEWREIMPLGDVPFVYHDMKDFEHKIIYYETSRGCPFSCSYCLSSVDKCLRFRDMNLVKEELQFFIEQKVPQVKFVDRTFNCNHKHAMAIWSYIREHDNGVTNFHFEVAADLLNEEELKLIETMRPGLIQLEIGVQSTNPLTVKEIKRTMDFEKVSQVVRRINQGRNVHQHLDLIAGLPHEDYESFGRSFNDVYALGPEQLQLGFLKVLKGSYMEEQVKQYELKYKDLPQYEVLSTKWLSYEDVIRLKGIEEMVEVYYNSGQFTSTINLLVGEFAHPFEMFERLSEYYEAHGWNLISHSRISRYEMLLAFIREHAKAGIERYRQLLTYDLYLRENVKNRPEFAGEYTVTKEMQQAFYEEEVNTHQYLQGYEQYDKRQLRKMTHMEHFSYDVLNDGSEQDMIVLFDYQNRDALTKQAKVFVIDGGAYEKENKRDIGYIR